MRRFGLAVILTLSLVLGPLAAEGQQTTRRPFACRAEAAPG
jgi:hypothetical protein